MTVLGILENPATGWEARCAYLGAQPGFGGGLAAASQGCFATRRYKITCSSKDGFSYRRLANCPSRHTLHSGTNCIYRELGITPEAIAQGHV